MQTSAKSEQKGYKSIASAAAAGKWKELTAAAYELWNAIEQPLISADGAWVSYTLRTSNGRGELVVRSSHGAAEFRLARGSSKEAVRFAAGSRAVVFSIDSATARDAPERDQGALAILSLPAGTVTKISRGGAFVLSGIEEQYVAYTVPAKPAHATAAPRHTLKLQNLISGTAIQVADVTEFAFDKAGHYLAYAVASANPHESGVYMRRLADGQITTLLSGAGQYRSLTFDASGRQLAFLVDRSNEAGAAGRYSLYYTVSPQSPAQRAINGMALSDGLQIDAKQRMWFSRTGNALIFALSSLAPESPIPTQVSASESKYEIWYSSEPGPFPQGLSATSPKPYLAVYHLAERRWMQLGSPTAPQVLLSEDAQVAVGIDCTPYRVQNTWDVPTADVYLIDTRSGESRPIRKALRSTFEPLVALSPDGRYLLYYENRRWFSYDTVKGRVADLTRSLLPATRFEADVALPENPPEGIAAWVEDRGVLLYEQHDLWQLDLSGTTKPRNLTAGVGRQQNIRFRLWADYHRELASERAAELYSPPVIAANEPLLLAALDQNTMASGIWQTRIGAATAPQKLLMLDKRIRPLARAAQAPGYLLTLETFGEFPDLWSGAHLRQLRRISNANPHQSEYRWGTVELVEFTSSLSVPLKARLYKPPGFDPATQYPMIVSINERESQRLHQYTPPRPLTSAPSAQEAAPTFASRGYVVLVPDVRPIVPYPGQSAVASVIPAVQGMIQRGYIDPKRICLSGHGFGGYGVAYAITQTNLFRCAIEGAGVTNSISAYASLRSRAWLFEKGPWRHGASIWQRPFVYLTNSPLLFADKVMTPLLILHNDGEQAIPYDQAFEFFTGLRRNGKEVYLLNYRGEGEVLTKPENRLDWDRRVHQFLDHYLKDAPKPGWFEFPAREETTS